MRYFFECYRQKINLHLKQRLAHFGSKDFNPTSHWKEPIIIFSSWFFPALVFTLWAKKYYPNVEFYREAIEEAIGANLWNLMGLFGIFSFGLAIVFSKEQWVAKVSRSILINTFAIGSISLGAIVGRWLSAIALVDFPLWKISLLNLGFYTGVCLVLFLNIFIWYGAFLLQNTPNQKSNFLIKLEGMHVLWKICFGIFFILLSAIAILTAT